MEKTTQEETRTSQEEGIVQGLCRESTRHKCSKGIRRTRL